MSLQLSIQGSGFNSIQKKSPITFAKQVNASGGFKIPQQQLETQKKQMDNKFFIKNEIPTQNELFAALGLKIDDQKSSNQVKQNQKEDNDAQQIQIEQKLRILRESRANVLKKKSDLMDNIINIDQIHNQQLRNTLLEDTSADEIEKLIQQHRMNMKPIEDSIFKKQREHQEQQQNQKSEEQIGVQYVKRDKSIKVKVTHHNQRQTESIDKLRRNQNDYNGPHGEFLKKVMPQSVHRDVRAQSAKVKQDDFQLRFKSYIRQKGKLRSSSVLNLTNSQKEFDLYQSTSPNTKRWNVKNNVSVRFKSGDSYRSRSKNSKRKQDYSTSPGDEELYLIEHFFNEIDKKSLGRVDKVDTIKYLMKNPQILNAFDIESMNLNRLINKYKTSLEGCFTKKEFVKFLKSCKSQGQVGYESGINYAAVGKFGAAEQGAACLLSKDQIKILSDAFDKMDINGDTVVNRIQFIRELRNQISVIRMLHIDASYIPSLGKTLNVDQVLSLVEQSYETSESKDQVEQISWQQFMQFFNNNHQRLNKWQSDQSLQLSTLKQELHDNIDDQDKYDAPEEMLDIIRQEFNTVDKYEELYALSIEVTDAIRRNPLYSKFRKQIFREQAKKYDRERETLEDILTRIDDEAAEYISLPELMAYFTRRGEPKFENNEEQNLLNSIGGGDRLTNYHNQGQVMIQANPIAEIDGYDSDPEIHTYQDKVLPRQRINRSNSVKNHITFSHHVLNKDNPNNSQMNTNKINKMIPHDTSQTFYVSTEKLRKEDFLHSIQPGSRGKPSNYEYKITRPNPFGVSEHSKSPSIRQIKLEKMVREKQKEEEDHLKQRFHAKDVPKHVKEALYQKIVKENEARREYVKTQSKQLTQQTEQPFDFYLRDKSQAQVKKRKNNYEREKFVFKAKAIPWHVHVDLWQKIQDEENSIRKERIAKHAQQLAMSSKMPERMERYLRLKQAQQMNDEQDSNKWYKHKHQPMRSKELPNFEKLQSEFQDQLMRKKQQMRTTAPKPFEFQKSNRRQTNNEQKKQYRTSMNNHMDQENQTMKATLQQAHRDPIQEAKKQMSRQPKIKPQSTKKWEANLEKIRAEREKKRQIQEDLEKEEIFRQVRKEEFKSRVQLSKAIQNNQEQLNAQKLKKQQDFKNQQKKQKEQFDKWRQERLDNAANQPLLVERPTKRDLKLEKMKTLYKMKKMMEVNNVKDQFQYFNEEEQNMLKDVEYLQKQGYGDDFDDESDGEGKDD